MRRLRMSLKRGFSIPELLVVLFILSIIGVFVWTLWGDALSLSRAAHSNLITQQELQTFSKRFVAEVRAAKQSEVGSYAIGSASSTEFSFYADADNDGIAERIRYFTSGTDLRKGTTRPTGAPLSYVGANETVTTIVRDVRSTTTPVFLYYDTSYTGTTSPLSSPVTTSLIRLVKVTLVAGGDERYALPPAEMSVQVTLRTLKDNL